MMARQALWLCAVATLSHLSLAQVNWCFDSFVPTTYTTTLGAGVTILPNHLCVKGANVTQLRIVPVTTPSSGALSYPFDDASASTQIFAYPLDDINFPPEDSIRLTYTTTGTEKTPQWTFTPRVGEECVYVVCFRGEDDSGVSTPTVRCNKIEVVNEVFHFMDEEAYTGSSFSRLIKPPSRDGVFMSGWVYPECDSWPEAGHNMTVMAFMSTRDYEDTLGLGLPNDKGLVTRNSIKYRVETGQFFYYDDYIGEVMSKGEYCCGKWHYVGVSITKDGEGTLYVDGASPKLAMEYERDVVKYSVVNFSTTSFPDYTGGGDNNFLLGGGFKGYIDEVGVWDTSITAEEFDLLMQTRTLTDLPPLFGDKTPVGILDFPRSPPRTGTFSHVEMAIPPMTGCILGLEHNVGPVDGACVTKVFGWNFADSMFPQCSFGGVKVRAEVIPEEIFPAFGVNRDPTEDLYQTSRCTTPGHISPRFVDVTYSNDGINFAQPEQIGRSVKHLFLESSLYVTGEGEGGAEADSVCQDLPSKAVTFGAWVCPKCGPPVPEPPPPPLSPPPPSPPPQPRPPPPSPPPPVEMGEGGGGAI